ncbi:hypothetical protein ACFQZC_12325 [Streptacidiphilus monticola]
MPRALHGAGRPAAPGRRPRPLHAELLARMGALLGRYAPEVPEDRIRDVAEVTVAAFKGILPLLVAADEQRLPQLVEEMEQLLLGYFSRALGLTT